jgi:hypothetical protein
VVSQEEWLRRRHQEELDRGVALTKRLRELEQRRREQVFVTDWHADDCETHRRDLDALLKSQGTEEGTSDPAWVQRYKDRMMALEASAEWPARRDRLSQHPRDRFQQLWARASA